MRSKLGLYRCNGFTEGEWHFLRAVRLTGEARPTGDGGVDLFDNGTGLPRLEVELGGEFEAVLARGLAALSEDRGRMFTARAGAVSQIVGEGQRPFAGLIIENKGEVLGMIVTIVGGEHHQPKQPQQVGMFARQAPRDLE